MADATPVQPPQTPGVVPPTAGKGPPVDPTKSAGSTKVAAPFRIGTAQVDRDRYIKLMVYSQHGGGKTELLASAADVPQMLDVLFVDAESGEATVEDNPRIDNWQHIIDNRVRVTDFMQVARVQEFLKAYCAARDRGDVNTMRKLYTMVNGGIEVEKPPQYRTVIIDTLNEVDAYSTYQVLKVDPTKVLSDVDGIDVAGWPEFRKNYEMMKLIVRAFRDLPMNVLVACADQYTKDQANRYHYGPRLTGKLGTEIQGFFDVVGYLVVGATPEGGGVAPRRLWIQPITASNAPKFDAKNRKSIYTEAYLEDPHMIDIMTKLGFVKQNTNPT